MVGLMKYDFEKFDLRGRNFLLYLYFSSKGSFGSQN